MNATKTTHHKPEAPLQIAQTNGECKSDTREDHGTNFSPVFSKEGQRTETTLGGV